MTNTKQPEALRIAKTLEALGDYNFATEAAEELGRQHAEIESLRAKLDKSTAALKSISNDNWPDADLNAGEYANLVLHELAAGAVDKPAASEVISESIDAVMR